MRLPLRRASRGIEAAEGRGLHRATPTDRAGDHPVAWVERALKRATGPTQLCGCRDALDRAAVGATRPRIPQGAADRPCARVRTDKNG